MRRPPRVLLVCTGNICRSPTAEAVLRAKADAAGLRVLADSAGTSGGEAGNPPDLRSVSVAAVRGYELPDRGARQVRAADFRDFDLVLPMTRAHERALRRAAPRDASARIELFARDLPGAPDVPDPWYGGPPDFEHALDMIEAGVDALVARLRAGAGDR